MISIRHLTACAGLVFAVAPVAAQSRAPGPRERTVRSTATVVTETPGGTQRGTLTVTGRWLGADGGTVQPAVP